MQQGDDAAASPAASKRARGPDGRPVSAGDPLPSGGGARSMSTSSFSRRRTGRMQQSATESAEVQRSRDKARDSGILSYVQPGVPGFAALLKHRYSDFIVNELGPGGEVLRVTDHDSLPPEPEMPPEDCPPLSAAHSLLLPEDVQALTEFAAKADKEDTEKLKLASELSKEERRIVHKAIRHHLPGLDTTSLQGSILVFPATAKTKRARTVAWPSWKPNFVEFLLEKHNLDTNKALMNLAHYLHCSTKSLSFAGSKDKRAITTQRVCAYRVSPERLAKVDHGAMVLGNYAYRDTQLRMGDLCGNRFHIALRYVVAPDDRVAAAMEAVARTGFINYFGLQRFGTSEVGTHRVGEAILAGDYALAVDRIMGVGAPLRHERTKAGKRAWALNRDPAEVLDLLPGGRSIEVTLMHFLKDHPNDFLGAIERIPRPSRTMYVHAYQSFLWNWAASQRLSKGGARAIVGDTVLQGQPSSDGKDNLRHDVAVKVIASEEEAALHPITDVVLPAPGAQISIRGPVKQLYDTILAASNLDMSVFCHHVKSFNVPGMYRHLVQRPQDLEWDIVQYDGPDDDLLGHTSAKSLLCSQDPDAHHLSSVRYLSSSSSSTSSTSSSSSTTSSTSSSTVGDDPDDVLMMGGGAAAMEEGDSPYYYAPVEEEGEEAEPFKAVTLAFSLPASCYATMMLREVTKSLLPGRHHPMRPQRIREAARGVESPTQGGEAFPASLNAIIGEGEGEGQ